MAEENVDQTRIAGNVKIAVAEVGTTMPDENDWETELEDLPGFSVVGFTDEAGVTFTDTKTVEGKKVHQRFRPIRYVVTEKEGTFEFGMAQFNSDSVPWAFGGGTVEETTVPGIFRFTPAPPEEIDERAFVLEVLDGTIKDRYMVQRGMVTSSTAVTLDRKNLSLLPVTFGVLEPSTGDAWWMDTDEPTFLSEAS